jgi:hypothetical protein
VHKVVVCRFRHLASIVCGFTHIEANLHSHNTILQEGYSLTLWILPAALAFVGLIAALAALRTRRRRSNRLQLRLLAGRRRLLGEEIETRSLRLAELDPEELATHRSLADASLDGIHVALLEREAHLQNLQDLAHLQQHKLAVLRRRYEELPTLPVGDDPAHPAASSKAHGGIIERREHLEDRFLETIQQRDDAPKPRPRRRRG